MNNILHKKITNFPANTPQVSRLLNVLLCACSRNLLVKLLGIIIFRRLYGPGEFLDDIGLVLLSTIGLSLKHDYRLNMNFI